MRERVYNHAQMKALETSKVIVIYGAGRFSEWREMITGRFSYIAVDPMIDTSRLNKWGLGFEVIPYDFAQSFESQAKAASRKPLTVFWARCTSEEFLSKANPIDTMSTLGIPAVFPFSVSYHIPIIKTLSEANISVYGCGYINDDLPAEGVGYPGASMTPQVDSEGRTLAVTAAFGKSTYVEPPLCLGSVPGVIRVEKASSDLWEEMDDETYALMRRAVFVVAAAS